MTVSMLLLTIASVLILFGAAQRVLDRMRLTDTEALIIAAVILFGGLIPNIPLGMVEINVGGALAPLAVCVYLLIRAGTGKERARALIGSAITGGVMLALGMLLPSEPEQIGFDPNYLYGIAGGVIAYALGRSRRSAFICGVLGMTLCEIATAVINWSGGVSQKLVLGGAGAADVIVISGLIAVILAELIGEIFERAARPKSRVNHDPIVSPVRTEGRHEE